jgi:single-strand DNA-binding protein
VNDIMVTAIGNVASDVRRLVTTGGLPMAKFRIASSGRRFDRARGEWIDLPATFITVVCWRTLADNALRSLTRGDPVVVTGRLRSRSLDRDGHAETVYEIEATSLGHDIARGTTTFRRRRREELGEVVSPESPPSDQPDLADAG